jgi:hypothetical protein
MPRLGDAQYTSPKRLILIQTGNGTILENWRSNGTGAAFRNDQPLPALSGPILAPLDRHREKLLLLDGLDLSSCYDDDGPSYPDGPSHGHAGASVLWTGVCGGGPDFGGDAGEYPAGPSVDQVIAQGIGADRPYRSLQLGVWRRPIDPRGVHSYADGGVPLPPELDPQAVYDRVFGGISADDGAPAVRESERRRRSLDVLRGELGRLTRELPGEDRARFESHLAGIDALEARIDALGGAVCAPGLRPGRNSTDADKVASVDAQMDIIKTAFACDLTRVASLTLTPENVWGPVSFVPEWVRGLGESHNVSHLTTDPSPSVARDAIDSVTGLSKWHATKMAELLDLLASVEEAPGETLLDNTVVVWGMAMSQGGYHTNRNTPFVVAHGANGPFRTGRYLRWGSYEQPGTGGCPMSGRCHQGAGNEANNRLLTSLCQGFGLDVDRFGDGRFTGALGGLV